MGKDLKFMKIKMNETLKKQEEQMKKLSEQMPQQAIRQMEKVLKRMFEEQGAVYDINAIRSCLVMCGLIMPQLPPIYSEFISSATLLLYRLLDEKEKGEIPSEILIP